MQSGGIAAYHWRRRRRRLAYKLAASKLIGWRTAYQWRRLMAAAKISHHIFEAHGEIGRESTAKRNGESVYQPGWRYP